MRKEILRHGITTAILLAVVTIFKRWLDFSVWPLWVGGALGMILPDLDHFLYIYLNPQELTSQRTIYMAEKVKVMEIFKLLAETRSERKTFILGNFVLLLLLAIFL